MNSELDKIHVRLPGIILTGFGAVSWLGFLLVNCNLRGEELELTPAAFGHSKMISKLAVVR